MSKNFTIDYVEFAAPDIPKAKAFYQKVFGWEFTDYGPDYTAFKDGRLDGGFTSQTPLSNGGPLVVLFADDLVACEKAVVDAGGTITTPPFDFPGGRRFHFHDPNGLELAVWGES